MLKAYKKQQYNHVESEGKYRKKETTTMTNIQLKGFLAHLQKGCLLYLCSLSIIAKHVISLSSPCF